MLAAGAAVAIAFKVSPWPRVLLIRSTGNDGMETADANEPFVPDDVDASLDLVYDARSAQGRLDVFRPAAASAPLPAVVWVHGGGSVAGNKTPLRPYLKVLASHGFVVVNVEYTHAPEATWPTPVTQLNNALAYLVAHADELGIDPDQLVLAGDSAGAHIAA